MRLLARRSGGDVGHRLPGLRQAGATVRHLPDPVGVRADGDANKRWDTSRNAVLSEILGFYGLSYWYAEQVTILGLGPIWQSDNVKAKEKAAAQLEAGGVMAFGLSEREHGADIYNTDMLLTPARRRGHRRGCLPGVGREVLHRQRQCGGHGVGVLAPHRRATAPTDTCGSSPTAATTTTSCSAMWCTARCS